MKLILLSALILFSTVSYAADENNKTTEELVAEFMKLHKEVEKEKVKTAKMKEKTKALEKLETTVDKLTNTLGVDTKKD